MVILFFFGNTPLVANEFIKEIIIMTLFYLVVLVTTFGCIEQAPISEEEMEVSNEIELSFLENKSASDESEDYDEYEKIVDSVVKCVKEKELFLDADLKLNSLSNKCNIPSYQISKSINFTLNKNFNEFINDFRIVEAKRKLSSSEFENVTILAIALESGFNSKSSFNAQFKKRENITPNEYRSTHSSK
jgi:AraC-like DNA-binding protein